MKKSTLLKVALVSTAMFMFTGAFAQQILTDYSEDETTEMYQTVNTTFRLYTLPDPVYSPSYVAASNGPLGANSQWRFVFGAGLTSTTVTSNTPIAQNWIDLTSAATNTYTVDVTELNTLAGCEDATARTTTIHIIAAPTAAVSGASSANTWNEVTAGHEYNKCGDALAENITVAITETGVPAALASYAYYVQKRVVNIDASGTEAAASETTSAFIDHPIATKYATSTADGGSEVVTSGAMPVVSYDWGDGNGSVLSRTKYEFTLMKASDAAAASAEGIVSGVSHKSDYIAIQADAGGDGTAIPDVDIATYAFTGTVTVVYIVNPQPVTGPVYHIPNNFNL